MGDKKNLREQSQRCTKKTPLVSVILKIDPVKGEIKVRRLIGKNWTSNHQLEPDVKVSFTTRKKLHNKAAGFAGWNEEPGKLTCQKDCLREKLKTTFMKPEGERRTGKAVGRCLGGKKKKPNGGGKKRPRWRGGEGKQGLAFGAFGGIGPAGR